MEDVKMKKNQGTDMTRKFGVEIEFGGVNRQQVADAMTAAGIHLEFEYWRNHESRDYSRYVWKLTTDGSVRVDGGDSLELVSPPMTVEGGAFQEIKEVCEVLNKLGAKVNKTCGLHVHHDAHDFSVKSFKQLYSMYIRFEGAIDELMPKSRRGNQGSYCASLINGLNSRERILEKLNACKTVSDMSDLWSSRYFKMNLNSYRAHGTIEFRHHSGTVDADKIINWVVLTQAMVSRATGATVQATGTADDWFNFKKVIRGYKWMGADENLVTAIEYFNKRRQKFMKDEQMVG